MNQPRNLHASTSIQGVEIIMSPVQFDRENNEKLWIGTSWKMTKTLGEAQSYVRALLSEPLPNTLNVFVLPAHTALATVRAAVPDTSALLLGAQDAHWAPEGAATGEISMRMVADAGASIVEIGHSERREAFCETDDRVSRKVRAAIDYDLVPLICVGESREVREAGEEVSFVAGQVERALARLTPSECTGSLFAYEPIWAIGQGGRPALAEEVAPVMAAMGSVLDRLSQGGVARALLYGGSVHVGNLRELLSVPMVDGVFVGRAAWDAREFRCLLRIAAEVCAEQKRGPIWGEARRD